jgi:two-component system, NtrC family, nitrogen regulation response regulator NtrX
MKRRRVLVIDDEPAIRRTLTQILSDEGYLAVSAASGEDGLARLRGEAFDLVFLDVWLKDRDGLAVLEALDGTIENLPVVMISGHGSIETAVRAVKLGAYDFLEKPLSLDRVVLTAQKAIERRDLRAEVQAIREKLREQDALLGESPAIRRVREVIARVAPTDGRVLISGENGTGKELAARMIHRLSARAAQPFVEVNCAAIPEELIESELFGHVRGSFTGAVDDRVGKFEEADGATLFLDEVGDMSPKTQAKVLRALEQGRFTRVGDTKSISSDARVLAATNKNLQLEIARGAFREDLYFRLAVIPLTIPPLRERIEDLPPLVDTLLASAATRYGKRPRRISEAAMRKLAAYSWPGNVRELKNLLERLLIMAPTETIGVEDLPVEIVEAPAPGPSSFSSLREAREDFERRYILQALHESRGNVTRAAAALGVERSNLYRKLRSYGIEVERSEAGR